MRGERWGNRNKCVFSPFSVPSPSSYHPLYMAGLLNDLYSLGKTPALWGGEGDGGLQHVTPGLPNQLLCWQTCTLYFIDCEIFQVVYIVQIRRLSLYGDYMIWILNEFLKIHLSKGGKCHGGRGGEGVSRTSLQDFPINKPLSCQELAMICDLFLLQQGSSQRWSPGTKSWIWSIICPPKNGKLQKEGI